MGVSLQGADMLESTLQKASLGVGSWSLPLDVWSQLEANGLDSELQDFIQVWLETHRSMMNQKKTQDGFVSSSFQGEVGKEWNGRCLMFLCLHT